jgi:hydroxymethylpyrimidine kinase/phosphomethylpyrimidine kinase
MAGFDPTGGAGIIADIRTILAFGCWPAAVVTSLTFQNSAAVSGSIHQTPESLRAQIQPVLEEFEIAAVKIGMLPTGEGVKEVVRLIQERKMPAPVVDPVLRSTSGFELMEPEARDVWLGELMPLARLITPNIPEAETLAGMRINNEQDMGTVARKLCEMGARAVLIKGGHLEERSAVGDQKPVNAETDRQAIDVLDDGGNVIVLRSEWIDSPPVRGTGCMLSAAIAACLGRGMNLPESVGDAKQFVADAIRKC